ncbi:chemotaxis protein CheB [Caballeronia sp. GAWG1-5s-s]|uniref:chemotaxis protein CheB n=1 Tax=Caballeronia sp. GAWG1-5s-s TaxID=2921743 RepID=UPI0020283F63|nr:chemotaxis protein CheB [Caballeronia sp. GAWG1-5s-s]
MKADSKQQGKASGPDFAVVGVGASAGGVQALLQLFEGAPASPGVAFVVVLHMSPDYASHAPEVIQRVTRLRVRQVSIPVPLEKDTVYVIPPGKMLSMFDGFLRLSEPEPPRLPPTSIDVFFRSLADAHGARSFAVVLSGSGADGSIGISRIREQGGVTIAQRPDTAQYGEMPRNAIGTGDIDLVLPVDEIIPRILVLAQNAKQIELPAPSDEERLGHIEPLASDGEAIHEVLEILRARTRHDFSNYKRGTVVRRIERRMQVNGLATTAAYREFLERSPDETPKLLADLLIGVTNFFRDPDAFAVLERTVIPEIFKNLRGRDEVRAWVPACATGEEAFSIAMLLDEAARRLPQRVRISVFASDIDERAIAVARSASYPQAIENDLTPARLNQYFNKDGSRYQLAKSLRDTVVFAAHNLLRDPPFSRMDLISCRNVLIYMDRRAQKQVLDTSYLSLRPNEGFLFLGTAESADLDAEVFSPTDRQKKIYRALPNAPLSAFNSLHPFVDPNISAAVGGQTFFQLPPGVGLSGPPPLAQARSLDLFGPPVLVMRSDGTIVHRSKTAERLTEDMRHTKVGNLYEIIRVDAQAGVRNAIQRCLTRARPEQEASVPLMTASGEVTADFSFRPFRDLAREEYLISVTCDLLTPLADAVPEQIASEDGGMLEALKAALEGSEERLRTSMEDQQASGEQLRATNEELQAMNEELRSATEELEASREELQSLNEELITVNAELLAKVHESARVSDDLQNLITLVGVATVFVDRALRIKRYTAPADSLFNIRSSDIGRPLEDLTHHLDYQSMVADLRAAFESLKRSEREVTSKDGRTFLARVLPYRTDDDRIDGAVLALIDISEQKSAQVQARLSEEKLRLAAHATHDFAIIVLDDDGTVVSWNVGAKRIFGFDADEMLGHALDPIFTAEDVASHVPAREREKAVQSGRAEDERWHATKGGARIFCSGFLSRIEVPGFAGYAKIVHDATKRKLDESRRASVLEEERATNTEIRKLSRLKDEFIAVLSHELKNPLNLIHMKAEILARLPEARHISRVQEVSDAIQKSVLAQAQIIDDLLDFSRIQTGKLTLRFAPTDVANIVRTVTDAMQRDYDESGIKLSSHLPCTPVLIRGDEVRIEQIVWNLLSNALKFTPRGGEVVVQLQQDRDKVKLEVRDTGCGIAPDALESIFEIFQQAPNVPYRARAGGLGIGLSLVRQLAELHGGTVEALSDGEGKGACFVVSLSTNPTAAAREAGDKAADLSIFRDARILLIQSLSDPLSAMTELLSLYGARITTSTTAAEALQAVSSAEFDVLVTDLGLSDMNSYELIRRLRSVPGCADTPIVAITDRPPAQEETAARDAGCDACLPKPFNLQALADVMHRLGRHRRNIGT